MFRAMLWKEVREQGAILLALIVLGCGVIAAATVLGSGVGLDNGVADFRAYTNAGRLAVLSLAIAAGVVVGGTLFAGEKENGTLDCLEMLPATRWRIWWGKLGAGVVMAFAAGVVLLAMGTWIGALGRTAPVAWLLWGMVLVFVAFGWGAFGSALTETTLAACAIGLLCAVMVGAPVFAVAALALRWFVRATAGERFVREANGIWLEAPALAAMYCVAVLPVLLAGWVFTAPDRARYARTAVAKTPGRATRADNAGFFGSLKALLWLTNRQWFVASATGFGLMLLAGVTALHDEMHLMLVWPAVTALAGVFGGVLAWADEQSNQTFKFWGERRLPLGRLWVMKVASSFTRTLGWTLLAFAPSLVRQLLDDRPMPFIPAAVRSGVLGYEGWSLLNYLLIWPAYGFAFGHLAGLLFRKTIVALGVGLLTAGPVAALWLPSLLTGGVHGWQLWPVPVLVLLSTRVLLRPWSADRLGRAKPLATVAVVAAACVLWTAFGLSYRFLEVPVAAEIDDDLAFADTVPQLDFDDGGRVFRQTTSNFRAMFSAYLPPEARPFPNDGPRPLTRDWIVALHRTRWPVDDLKALGEWRDNGVWTFVAQSLKDAANKPLGPIENPRGIAAPFAQFRDAVELQPMVSALLAWGLWKQEQGEPKEFAACLDAALAATRNARTMQPSQLHQAAYAPERMAFDAADEWLRRAGPQPDLIRGVLAALEKHGRLCPRGLNEAFLTERMIDRNRLVGVSQWAPLQLEYEIGQYWKSPATEGLKQKANVETELLSFSLAVPWEKERYRRLLGQHNAGGDATRLMSGWLASHFRPFRSTVNGPLDLASQSWLAVTLTQFRLKLFELEKGIPAAALGNLVPEYAAAVPVDPYDGKPLRYRISEGEKIDTGRRRDLPFDGNGEENLWRDVEPGSGVVWSVGPDSRDGDGKVEAEFTGFDQARGDFIRVVPRARKGP